MSNVPHPGPNGGHWQDPEDIVDEDLFELDEEEDLEEPDDFAENMATLNGD